MSVDFSFYLNDLTFSRLPQEAFSRLPQEALRLPQEAIGLRWGRSAAERGGLRLPAVTVSRAK